MKLEVYNGPPRYALSQTERRIVLWKLPPGSANNEKVVIIIPDGRLTLVDIIGRDDEGNLLDGRFNGTRK